MVGEKPSPRYSHGASRYTGATASLMYIIGGFGSGALGIGDVWIFDFATSIWKPPLQSYLPVSIKPFFGNAYTTLSGIVFSFGGRDADFSPATSVWI